MNLFATFDKDGSGALDPDELVELYEQNGIFVNEAQIALLYDHPNVKFNLDEFKNITKDAQRLQTYRKQLKRLYRTLKAKAAERKIRNYIPRTFDAMMVDFGQRLERNQMW